ncbi:hypothetical protein PMI01_05319 [Caulobacter sp. AP07]|uniref:hypothetical protein n=1 Tax=Caulobacter sp. AP07 TaxID=1144304 RepID=UPI000271DA94|nr:hypothetical protein [Caulobacter sp. AP07]EJL21065.1 hypothetical protein PMI01_05319 [Caulobacter sp. AP07]
MRRSFGFIAPAVLAGILVLGSEAVAQECDPDVCANPNDYRHLVGAAAPRTFTTLKAAKVLCPSEPIVWRTRDGRVYGAKAKAYGKIKPGYYMCRSHSNTITRINAQSLAKPR